MVERCFFIDVALYFATASFYFEMIMPERVRPELMPMRRAEK
jgi:hypothetical protein